MSGRETRAGKRHSYLTIMLTDDKLTHDRKLSESIAFFEKVGEESRNEGVDVGVIVWEVRKMIEAQIKKGEVVNNLDSLSRFLKEREEKPFKS